MNATPRTNADVNLRPPLSLALNGQMGPGADRPRIALYSHDTQGLGHIRRNLLIASALAGRGRNPVVLLVSGLREAAAYAMPDGVDCLTLPSLAKSDAGVYSSRSLDVSMTDVIHLRSRTITAALRSFQPDAFIVDKVPLGAFDELQPCLRSLQDRGQTKVVLGLREILDDPQTVREEWTRGRYDRAIRRFFDQVWVYGDRRVFDTVEAYGFPADLAEMTRFTGYLNPVDPLLEGTASSLADFGLMDSLQLPPGRLALCVVGGGRDGLPLAEAFLNAPLPKGTNGVLVTGPLMPKGERDALRAHIAGDARKRVLEFITNPIPLMVKADVVIAMGGYNTITEVLGLRKQALIVPRTRPRTEQLVRAQALSRIGALDMLDPDALGPATIGSWIAGTASRAERNTPSLDMDGVQRLPHLLQELLDETSNARILRAIG